jgi:hypothetical protein
VALALLRPEAATGACADSDTITPISIKGTNKTLSSPRSPHKTAAIASAGYSSELQLEKIKLPQRGR